MLTFTRRIGEPIAIGDDITVTVLGIETEGAEPTRVRIAVLALTPDTQKVDECDGQHGAVPTAASRKYWYTPPL